jgi:hypothetical protein
MLASSAGAVAPRQRVDQRRAWPRSTLPSIVRTTSSDRRPPP